MSQLTIRNLIICATLLAVTLGTFLFAIYFLKGEEKTLRSQMETLEKERQQDSFYFELEKISENSRPDREVLDQYLLKEEGQSIDVLTWIETRAPKAGVTLETKSLQKISDKEAKTDWIEVSFAFSGTREDVEDFVKVLENLPYTSHLTDLTLIARSSTNWEAQTTLRILLFKAL